MPGISLTGGAGKSAITESAGPRRKPSANRLHGSNGGLGGHCCRNRVCAGSFYRAVSLTQSEEATAAAVARDVQQSAYQNSGMVRTVALLIAQRKGWEPARRWQR